MIERYEFDPAALDEYEEAVTFYELRREGLGARFIMAVEDTIQSILAMPDAGASWPAAPPGLQLRRRQIRNFPAVFLGYAFADGALYILAVGHSSRRPGYWLDRAGALLAKPRP